MQLFDFDITLWQLKFNQKKTCTKPYQNRPRFVKDILLLLLLGRVALVAQRPIVVKLSRGRSVRSVGPYVRRSVGLSVQCIVENGRSDPDAVWHHRSDGSSD